MRTAVTGATGFVGRHLLAALRQRGWSAACLVRRKEAAAPLREDGWDVVVGDLDDEGALAELTARTDVVFHVAGVHTGDLQRVNVGGSERLARASHRAAAARVVYLSSLAVSGPSDPRQPHDAADRTAPIGAYGRSKAEGERAVMESGVPFTIVRAAAAYGPFDRELLRVFRWALKGTVPMVSDGSQPHSLLYGPDLGAALVAAAERPATLNRAYHLAHPQSVTLRELVTGVGDALGRRVSLVPLPSAVARMGLEAGGVMASFSGRRFGVIGDRGAELVAPAWTCLSREFERDARWGARTAFAAGIAATAAWYRESGWLFAKRP